MPASAESGKPAGRHGHTFPFAPFAALVVLLVFACAAGAAFGSSSVSVGDLFALVIGGEIDPTASNILVNVRLPRVGAAVLAGSALGCAGAIIQGALDNPLASPNVIGINSGAGLAVLLASSLAPRTWALFPLAAFVGAVATAALVFAIAMRAGSSKIVVVLAGMALTALFGAGMNAVLIIDPDAYIGASGFLVGGLSGVQAQSLAFPAAYIAVGFIAAVPVASRLNTLSLGDGISHSLGMNVPLARMASLAVAAVLAGAAVSFAGLLGFVGLIVPHVMRAFVGHDHRLLLPASALAGAGFVTLCDLLARVLFAPYELPVGILMAALGGPFFIFLVLRRWGRDAW